MLPPDSSTRLIALDWGTSSARAYRVGAPGEVLERRLAPLGILHVRSGGFLGAARGSAEPYALRCWTWARTPVRSSGNRSPSCPGPIEPNPQKLFMSAVTSPPN